MSDFDREPQAASASEGWRGALVPETATLNEAIRSLDTTGLQIVMVVSGDSRLQGTVTDGDIRRGFLRGLDLSAPVSAVMSVDPLVVPPQFGRDTVVHLMRANKLRQLPVVDGAGRVLGLHLWDEMIVPIERPNPMVIMAGGKGVRLRPHTENCPKPLVPVAGKPMLEHIIDRARTAGFRHFVVAVHFLGHMIEDYFGDGSKWGVRIEYIREDVPLGTAGAMALLQPRPDVPLLVSNGDVLTDVHYGELLDFHSKHGAAGTMAVRLHEWQHPFGVVRTDGVDITGFEEKPIARSHINAGIYVLEPSALDLLDGDYCDMPTLFSRLHDRHARTIVYPMHEPWLDVGQADDLARADKWRTEGDRP